MTYGNWHILTIPGESSRENLDLKTVEIYADYRHHEIQIHILYE